MSKGPKIKGWVKWHIRNEALKDRAEPRDSVAERIEEYLEGKESVPSRDTINKLISGVRNSDDPEDGLWTVLLLADYDIPPEVLPVVLQAWAKALLDDKPLTIRQVKWIARLYYLYLCKDETGLLTDTAIGLLAEQAVGYARLEKAVKLTGTYPDLSQDMNWLWFRDAFLRTCTIASKTDDHSLVAKIIVDWRGEEGKIQHAVDSTVWDLLSGAKEVNHERTHSEQRKE